jgi:hypothetical protein
VGGGPVAGVGPVAQELLGLVQVPAGGQQLGQLPGGGPVAGVGAVAQLVQVSAVGQQPGQLVGGVPVAEVGPGAQELLGLVQVGVSVRLLSPGTRDCVEPAQC